MQVLLYLLNPRRKNIFLAKGILVRRDKTYLVVGNNVGEQYLVFSISVVSRLGDERIVRPYKKFQIVRDSIGHVIEWPLSYISTLAYNH